MLAVRTSDPLQRDIFSVVHSSKILSRTQVGEFDLGGLHSSLWVPPLLAAFYVTVGILHTALDDIALTTRPYDKGQPFGPLLAALQGILSTPGNTAATRAAVDRSSIASLALNNGVIAALLYLSAVLYSDGWDYPQISAVLSVAALLSYKAFDGTRQGLALALLCAVAAPASEMVLINLFGLWEYGRPDVFGLGGFPSWVPWCYFFYTSGVGNLARLLQKQTV